MVATSTTAFLDVYCVQNTLSGKCSKRLPRWWMICKNLPLPEVTNIRCWCHATALIQPSYWNQSKFLRTVKSPLISPLCVYISCGGFVCLFISLLRRVSFNFICMLGCCSFCIAFNIFRVFGELEVWRVRLFPLVNVAFRREMKKMEKINSTSTSTESCFFFFYIFTRQNQ